MVPSMTPSPRTATTGAHRIMREVNRGIILDLLRGGGRLSRVDLSQQAGLSKPTVSNIVEALLREGLVREVGARPTSPQGGRPPALLEYNGASAAMAGIHFGVHSTHVALADALGNVISRVAEPTILGSPRRSARQVARMVRSLRAGSEHETGELRGAGVSVPGLVDPTTGHCRLAPNLGWRDVPLGRILRDALGIPVAAGNTTALAALAEGRLGAARSVSSYVWIYTGTGVGAGIVSHGQLFSGAHGFSGEIGHCPVLGNDLPCNCGNRGCLETVAGASAIVRAAEQAVRRRQSTSLRRHRGELDAATVAQLAAAGDAVSQQILRQAGEHLGRGIAYILNLFGPEMVVLGGPLARGGEHYVDAVQRATQEHTLSAQCVPIVPSTLGPQVALLGAVQLAVENNSRSYRIVGAAS
jgi:predicted NBD/HSP70 family sugar kinase